MLQTKVLAALVICIAALMAVKPAHADSDDELSARVKQSLIAAELPDAAEISVTSFNGDVTISGVVRSEHIRDETLRIAGAVRAVGAIRNSLTVRAPSGAPDEDSRVSDRVRQALVEVGLVSAGAFEITTFNGAVDLSGVVASVDELQTAARIAAEVRGVSAVRNDLKVRAP